MEESSLSICNVEVGRRMYLGVPILQALFENPKPYTLNPKPIVVGSLIWSFWNCYLGVGPGSLKKTFGDGLRWTLLCLQEAWDGEDG